MDNHTLELLDEAHSTTDPQTSRMDLDKCPSMEPSSSEYLLDLNTGITYKLVELNGINYLFATDATAGSDVTPILLGGKNHRCVLTVTKQSWSEPRNQPYQDLI